MIENQSVAFVAFDKLKKQKSGLKSNADSILLFFLSFVCESEEEEKENAGLDIFFFSKLVKKFYFKFCFSCFGSSNSPNFSIAVL